MALLPLTANNIVSSVCWKLSNLLKENNFDAIGELYNEHEEILKISKNKGVVTTMLRYGIRTNNYDLIKSLIPKLSMKRDYFELMLYFKSKEVNSEIFKKNVNVDSILSDDIKFIIENDMSYLLKFLEGKFIEVDYPHGYYPDTTYIPFKKFYFQKCEHFFDLISSKILPIDKERILATTETEYNIIIDAGNVLHSRDGNVNIDDLESVVNSFSNPLIIIHEGHLRRNNQLLNFLKDKNHFITPKNYCDDLFILLAYLKKTYQHSTFAKSEPRFNEVERTCKIITNDKYTDHTFENNDFRFHVNDDSINYTNIKGVITFSTTYSFSRCIQVIENDVYIPTKNGFFNISN